ncbi:hypothetical protein CTI12_AA412820 [Artemisia annua]|uniref:Uncharacterized protein n=1 Tax=Artemisia annua TaxID=35608 RepID=A0A2U1M766_ARTAN|nr:hypothetical protein CTI12_AA412820 [Artemisia annua]
MSLNPKFSIYVIEDIYAIETPKDTGVKNPTGAVKGGVIEDSRERNVDAMERRLTSTQQVNKSVKSKIHFKTIENG